MGIKYDERYGFVDDRTGDILRAKILSAAPPKYRVWDMDGGVWEATGESRPVNVDRVSLNGPWGTTPGLASYMPSYAPGGLVEVNGNVFNAAQTVQQAYYNTASVAMLRQQAGLAPASPTVPLTQVWTFEKVSRPAPPEVKGDDKKIANDFLIGCDPEAAALMRATATTRNENDWPTLVEQDLPVNLQHFGVRFDGPVGFDHNGRVLEIRPSPFRGSYALTKELRKLINEHPTMKSLREKGLKLRAGAVVEGPGRRLSLGGHIHLGVDPNKRELVPALDRVTATLEQLDVLPANDCVTRRRGEYGHFGDTRTAEDHFGDLRVEYRTMPSWLYDPKVTFIALTSAKLAALDPSLALESLPQRSSVDWTRLRNWVAKFREKDENAARLDRMIETPIAARTDQNLFEVWERPLGF